MLDYRCFGDMNQNNKSMVDYGFLENVSNSVICFAVSGSTRIPILIKPLYQDDNSSSTLENLYAFDEQPYLQILRQTTNQSNVSSLEAEVRRCLNKLYSFHASDVEALGYLFELIENAFSKHDLLFVNTLLANFDPNQTKTIVSTGLLRVTSRAKSKLGSWKLCAAHISEHLTHRGENTKHLLRGLIRTDDSITISTTTLS